MQERKKMKCVPKIIKKKFDDLEIDDFVIFKQYSLGDFEGCVLERIEYMGKTVLHKHQYAIINGERWYKHDNPMFRVLVLNAKKR